MSRLPLRRRPLLNKLPVLDASKQLFSYFYILDEPFTATTFVVVLVHAGAAVYFGYGLSW